MVPIDRYVDLVGEMTAGLFGHTQPVLLRAIEMTARGVGLSLGAVSAAEARYARLLCARFGLERVRFTNSGTEANCMCDILSLYLSTSLCL